MRALLIAASLCAAMNGYAQEAPERWELIEELRIGNIDGATALSSVHALLLSPDGREIYVGQHRENLIRVFDAVDGTFLRTIGRRGQGPGEFNWLMDMGWKADTLVVKDAALRRMTLLSQAGQHLRTDPSPNAPVPGAIGSANPITYLANGTIVGLTNISLGEVIGGEIQKAWWVQMTRDGSILRTLAERDVRNAFSYMEIDGRGLAFGQPLSETVFVRIAPNGSTVVVARGEPATDSNARIQVTRFGLSGDTIYNRFYRYTPRPMTQSFKEEVYRPYLQAFADFPTARVREMVEENVMIPPAIPPVTSVTVGPDGTVWFGRGEFEDSERWVVLAPTGVIRATVRGPKGLDIKAVSGDIVWGNVADELGVPYVVRYRVHTSR